MHGPRDTPQLGVPVNPRTGAPLKPVVSDRLRKLYEAGEAFQLVLHELDGTTFGSRPGDRQMARAFDKFDEALLWAAAAVLEFK